MAKKRTLLLLKAGDPPPEGGLAPLGSLSELRTAMLNYNIAPDGSGPIGLGERFGTGVFHGPGMVLEISLPQDDRDPDIKQVLIAVTDEDFAWPVISRMCKGEKWKLMDPESGRTFLG
jgi:hypothetical protein